jgi:DNA polymerase-3 subunit alpha (Gram-positive type)
VAAFLLGITEVNPLPSHEFCPQCHFCEFHPLERRSGVDLKPRPCPECGAPLKRDGHNIPFETFVGIKGDKVPDIDLNFAPEVQNDIQKYVETLFGEGKVFKAGTISTFSEKTAFGYVKKYFEAKGLFPRGAEIERLKAGLMDVKRTTGQHPGGVILVPHSSEITDFTPVQYPGDLKDLGGKEKAKIKDLVITHFDYHAIDENLVKLDILGKDDASAFRHLQDLTGVRESEVPLDDAASLSLFSSHAALGFPKLGREEGELFGTTGAVAIPEFGTENTRRMLELTKPQTFTELIYISGLSHGTDVWANNAEELIKAKTASLETVISTRDDIMNRLMQQGMQPAMAFQITEAVRKGKVAQNGFTPEEEAALKTAKLPQWWIESCKKIRYMFPKAHATAYCFTAVRMAYFKVHHPLAFYAAWLTLHAQGFETVTIAKGRAEVLGRIGKLRQMRMDNSATGRDEETLNALVVAYEAILRGVQFDHVDLYQSHPFRFIPLADMHLLPPLVSLPGLGDTAALHIEEERKAGPFRSVEDMAKRAGLNKTVVEKLSQTGALSQLPATDQITLF